MIDTWRHERIIPVDIIGDTEFHVIGCGALGSKIALEVAKLGATAIHVWDFDNVEAHNVANQIFSVHSVGLPKAIETQRIIKELTDIDIVPHVKEVKDEALVGVVFLMTDTMSSRKEIFENCIKQKWNVHLMIEGRLDDEAGIIHTIRPMNADHLRFWETTLFADEEAPVSACGASNTIGPTANIISNLCVWQMAKWAKAQKDAAAKFPEVQLLVNISPPSITITKEQ